MSDSDAHVYTLPDRIIERLRQDQSTERIELGYPTKVGVAMGQDGAIQVQQYLKAWTEDKSGVLHKEGVAEALKTVAEAGHLQADNKAFYNAEDNNLEHLLERWLHSPFYGSVAAPTAADRWKPLYCSVTWDKLVNAVKAREEAEQPKKRTKKNPEEEKKVQKKAASLKLFMAFWTAYIAHLCWACPSAVSAP